MPFCPGCRQEYESFAKRCPDCQKDLVATLTDKVEKPPTSVVVAVDRTAADRILARLRALRVPCMEDPGEDPLSVQLPDGAVAILVPEPVAKTTIDLLGRTPGLRPELTSLPAALENEADEDAEEVACVLFHAADTSAATPAAPVASAPVGDVLREPSGEILRRGDAALDELTALALSREDRIAAAAIFKLRGLGDVGLRRLAALVAPLAKNGSEPLLYAVLKEVKSRVTDAGAFSACADLANDRSASGESRRLALHALGQLGIPALHARIVPLLDDPDAQIREEADEALCSLADDDLGFDPGMSPTDRQRVMGEWRRLFADRLS